MNYTVEILKIIEGGLKRDALKVSSYASQLVKKMIENDEVILAKKVEKLLLNYNNSSLSNMSVRESSMPVDSESRSMLADIIYPESNHSSVILSKTNEKQLNDFILSYKNSDALATVGLDTPNTMLLYGPPGCGKTQCAYFIAREFNLPLVIARLDSLISSYLGTTAKNIRLLFDFAQSKPCVLFLDEFDAVAKARDDANELGELKRVVNSLLQNIDIMRKDNILIAASNHEKLLDPAIWRRFDYKLKIDYPDTYAINKLVEKFIPENIILNLKEKDEVVLLFNGLSGADIEEILKKALRNSVLLNKEFNISSIFEELFIFKKLSSEGIESEKGLLVSKAKYLRNCNEKVFTYENIAKILGVETHKIFYMAKRGELKNE